MLSAKSKNLLEALSTITVRNVPSEVDEAITEQAKLAGRSKSDFIQGFLTATFGDLIGNYIRTSELVALMDKEMARMMRVELTQNTYDVGMTLAGHRDFCRILGILETCDVHNIMMAGVPLIGVRARQMQGCPGLPHGVSLYAALFAEAARRDLETIQLLHRTLFHMMDENEFLKEIAQFREAMRLPLLESDNF